MTGSARWISGVVGVGAIVASLSTGVVSASASNVPAFTSGAVAAVGATTASTSQLQRLERLAREVARPSGGAVTVEYSGVFDGKTGVRLLVTTRRGAFTVAAWSTGDAGAVAAGELNCRNDQEHPEDGRVCTTLRATPRLGIWARDYPEQPGRQTLDLAADGRDGGSVFVQFINYTENEEGIKKIGPTWRQAGITPSGLRDAAVDSGLLAIRN